MKNLYHKNKDNGKVYPSPSPSSSSSSSSSSSKDVLSLLPAAILLLVSVLSLEDREVLSYLITLSLKSTNPSSSSKILVQKFKKTTHKPLFDCGCFNCYTSFWFRWDSSPNRELIHQVIEAFEEHLSKRDDELLRSSSSSPSSKHKGRRKDKISRRNSGKHQKKKIEKDEVITPVVPEFEPEKKDSGTMTEDIVVDLSECGDEDDDEKEIQQVLEEGKESGGVKEEEEQETAAAAAAAEETGELVQVVDNGGGHKGLARKVLPDVLGILNSRLWSLWSPNV